MATNAISTTTIISSSSLTINAADAACDAPAGISCRRHLFPRLLALLFVSRRDLLLLLLLLALLFVSFSQ